MAGSWAAVEESALGWIRQASLASSVTGFDVGGLPGSILVLHRMYERVDGQPVAEDDDPLGGYPESTWIGSLPAEYRLLAWREYAQRRGTELTGVNRWPFTYADDGVLREPNLRAPEEGSIDNVATWHAITATLTAHSPDGADTWCTAYYYDMLAFHAPSTRGPHVFRGLLGDADELMARPQVSYNSPQNLWPDDHAWVLYTDYDAWYSKISGTGDLIRAIAENPELETLPADR